MKNFCLGVKPHTLLYYDKEQNLFICPRGKKLQRRWKNYSTNQVIYRPKEEELSVFADRKKCIDSARAIAREVARYDKNKIDKALSFLGFSFRKRTYTEAQNSH